MWLALANTMIAISPVITAFATIALVYVAATKLPKRIRHLTWGDLLSEDLYKM